MNTEPSGKCERREAARAIEHRAQRFAALDRIDARETHFAEQRDLLLLAPLRHFLDVQEIEWLQQQVRAVVAAAGWRRDRFR